MTRNKNEFATIGYESASLDDFIATVTHVGIEVVVDVRELPQSRRKGFSKTALSEALSAAGIRYVHLRGLGDPKPGRDAARAGDFKKFKSIFKKHLTSSRAVEDMDALLGILRSEFACLLCYERNSKECHRRIIADSASEVLGYKAVHLGVRQGIADNGTEFRV